MLTWFLFFVSKDTFLAVGVSYGILAVWNHLSLMETQRSGEWWEKGTLPWHDDFDCYGSGGNENRINEVMSAEAKVISGSSDALPVQKHKSTNNVPATIAHALKDIAEQWTTLLADPKVRPVVIMNGFYLCALSGTQLALSATAMGQVYMFMSAVQVLGNPAAGRFADQAGKRVAIVAGGSLTSVAMASVPIICAYGGLMGTDGEIAMMDSNWPLLAATLGFWALGGTLLATSHVSDCLFVS